MIYSAGPAALKIVRRAAAIVLVMMGLGSGLILFGLGIAVDDTVARSRDIDRQFRAYADAVVQFEDAHHRLPGRAELKTILPAAAYGRYNIELVTDDSLCDRDSEAYSQLQESAYVLWVWRGEWGECLAPRTGITTVTTDRDEYSFLGSQLGDQIALGAMVLACLAGAAWLWKPTSLTRA